MVIQPILDMVSLFYQKGLRDVVVCPGSRSAALTIAFNRHGGFDIKTIYDERSAGYIALGITLATQKPTLLVCTSGTAAMNFAPSICEAFYQKLPLVVLTADRPSEWIDQGDGQSIRQQQLFQNHTKASYQLPSDYTHNDAKWAFLRWANEATELAQTPAKGPVHLNIPIREPFYPLEGESFHYPVVNAFDFYNPVAKTQLSIEHIPDLTGKNVLAFCGQAQWGHEEINSIKANCRLLNIPLIAESIANVPDAICTHELILKKQQNDLLPDVLLTFGDAILSKGFKNWVRKAPDKLLHWHIEESHRLAPDVFQKLNKHFNVCPTVFFSSLSQTGIKANPAYLQKWQTEHQKTEEWLRLKCDTLPFGEMKAINETMQKIPGDTCIHVSNSMPIRYVNFLPRSQHTIYCNRGTSGIDGSNSTAIGFALKSSRPTVLISGDMSFLYDRNAFWHEYDGHNLKVLVLNNGGGGIFRMIDGPAKQPELEEFFVTRQRNTARFVAEEFGFRYLSAIDESSFSANLELFLENDNAVILEVFTDGERDTEIFKQHFQ